MSRSTSYRLTHEGYLPKPLVLGRGLVRWRLEDVERIEAQAAADRGGR